MPAISDEEYKASHDGKPRTGVFPYLIDTWRADTLEELADKLGIEDKATFLDSVKRYNELCGKGKDEDFGKEAKWMNAIKTPPFYGIRRHLRVSALVSGVYTNANGQALDADKNPLMVCTAWVIWAASSTAAPTIRSMPQAFQSAAAIPLGVSPENTLTRCPAVPAR